MINEIWNKCYNIRKMIYKTSWWTIQWVDFTIIKHTIKKETEKSFMILTEKMSTFLFWVNEVCVSNHWEQRCKKEDVEISNEDKDKLIQDLWKAINIINNDDNICENHKKQYRISYDLILEYLKNNNF